MTWHREVWQDSRIWRVFTKMVEDIYAAPHEDRVGVAYRYVEREFPGTTSDWPERLVNTALRVVAFIEAHKDG